jgi:hypothetical protein
VSDVAEETGTVELPPGWERLEHAADEALLSLDRWRTRALAAEEEIVHLRTAIEDLKQDAPAPADARDQIRRLRAENTALRSRMNQAHRRISALLSWTDALGGDA